MSRKYNPRRNLFYMTLRGKRVTYRLHRRIYAYILAFVVINFFFSLSERRNDTFSISCQSRRGLRARARTRARASVSIISSISNAIERFCIRNLFHGLCAPARPEFNGTRHLGHIVRAFFKQRVREGQKVYLNSRCLSATQRLEYAADVIIYV